MVCIDHKVKFDDRKRRTVVGESAPPTLGSLLLPSLNEETISRMSTEGGTSASQSEPGTITFAPKQPGIQTNCLRGLLDRFDIEVITKAKASLLPLKAISLTAEILPPGDEWVLQVNGTVHKLILFEKGINPKPEYQLNGIPNGRIEVDQFGNGIQIVSNQGGVKSIHVTTANEAFGEPGSSKLQVDLGLLNGSNDGSETILLHDPIQTDGQPRTISNTSVVSYGGEKHLQAVTSQYSRDISYFIESVQEIEARFTPNSTFSLKHLVIHPQPDLEAGASAGVSLQTISVDDSMFKYPREVQRTVAQHEAVHLVDIRTGGILSSGPFEEVFNQNLPTESFRNFVEKINERVTRRLEVGFAPATRSAQEFLATFVVAVTSPNWQKDLKQMNDIERETYDSFAQALLTNIRTLQQDGALAKEISIVGYLKN